MDVEDFKEKQPPLIYFIAGEPSGDALGGRLLAALKERQDIRVTGIGGPMMAEQGLASLFPMQELSVMGVAEVLPHLPKLIKRIKQTVSDIKKNKPVMLVTIDSPGFNFRVAKQLKGQGIKLVHYVAPSVWAWRPGRARKVARFLDHLLTLLPFEPPYFEREGLPTTFVGHPVIEYGADKGDGVGFRRRHQIPGDAPLLAVLPGSRAGEISRLMPVFKETVSDLAKSRNNMEVVIPVVPPMRARVETDAASWPVRVTVIGSDEKFDAFDAANAGLAASGTVALELAMSKTPSVIAYKVNVVTVWLGRILVKSPYVNLVNIILGREAVPELLFDKCRADLLAPAIAELLDNEEVRKTQNDAALEALSQLGLGGPSPSGRAADAILNLIHEGVRK
ncbi:MAG: lipid-A-disaccharide synthase [Rhodospirillaceae bacterium]|nr:lipid-A-disaccharide synthase [Rhodospirillaceae bacterium]